MTASDEDSEARDRVRMMARDGEDKWDLSPKDKAALRTILHAEAYWKNRCVDVERLVDELRAGLGSTSPVDVDSLRKRIVQLGEEREFLASKVRRMEVIITERTEAHKRLRLKIENAMAGEAPE